MSKVKTYTLKDISNDKVLLSDVPIKHISEMLKLEPRHLAHCALKGILVDDKYKIECSGFTNIDYHQYKHYKDSKKLMENWDETVIELRRILQVGRN